MEIKGKVGTRHFQLLLITACITSGAAIHFSFGVTIVAITNSKNHNWTSREISLVLSSFNWGLMVLLVPSGYLVNLFSPKRLFSYGMLFGSTVTISMPLLVQSLGWKGACVGRIAVGLGEAFINVCAYELLSKWAPPQELSRMCAAMMSGHILGAIIGNCLSGFIASSSIGWPSIFYVFGLIGIISAVLVAVYVADSPQMHPTISPEEKAFIAKSFRKVKNYTELKSREVPWKKILTSMPVWSIVVAQCGLNWTAVNTNYECPVYMKHVMKFATVKIGLISTAGLIAMWLMIFITGWTADYAFRRGLSVIVVRRLSNTLGLWTIAIATLSLGLAGPEREILTIALYIFINGMASGVYSGFIVNQIDISPNFAGTIQSIVTFVGMFVWIFVPIVCGAIVTDLTNVHQWKIFFHVTAPVLFLSNVTFLIYGRAEIQPWDAVPDHTRNANNEELNKLQEITTREMNNNYNVTFNNKV